MMNLNVPNELSESLEAEDDRRLKNLRQKMRKRLG
jgi:hypothetical protein